MHPASVCDDLLRRESYTRFRQTERELYAWGWGDSVDSVKVIPQTV